MASTTPTSDVRSEAGRLSQSSRKHQAILRAAETVFLQNGYLGANMDEVAALSGVSKQTVYSHFGTKDALFVEMVTSLTDAASTRVHDDVPGPTADEDLATYLLGYAERQLATVLTPELLQLRRLVIGEVSRFPGLAVALYESGPQRALVALAAVFTTLAEQGRLSIDDPDLAASQFNWLIMSDPLNRAMLLGDAGVPPTAELHRHAAAGVRLFLAAHPPQPADGPGRPPAGRAPERT